MEIIVGRLMSKRADTRMRASFALMRGGRPALARALELVHDPRPRMRAMACTVLGRVGYNDYSLPGQGLAFSIHYREAVPALLRLLEEDPAPQVRSSAATALGFQHVPETLPALCRHAYDRLVTVRWGVVLGLGEFYGGFWEEEAHQPYRAEVIAALLHLMDDKDTEVRDWATFAIHQGAHDTPETRMRLWRALDDRCEEVRGEAADGLAKFGDRSLIPRLEQLLKEEDSQNPLYFSAAEQLGDPVLLPAVEEAAARWHRYLEPEEKMHPTVLSALETLRTLKQSNET